MTDEMAAAAARLLPDGVALEALTADFGFPVIASRASYAVAARAVVETYARARGPYRAVLIGCFGDPGLEALRAAAREPVFGLAESSIREAHALGEPFAILTMGKAWVDILNKRVALASEGTPFVGVFAGEGTGLDVSRRQAAVVDELDGLARTAVAAGARTLILGGAALTGMANRLSADARLIDCVEATVRAALATPAA
jgi:Asp/Glu/hydantoin racemase